jgi:hypothetical protein
MPSTDRSARRVALLLTACALAALAPLLPSRGDAAPVDFPGWPAELDGRPLRELPLSEREERFARGFPGRTARFTDGRRELIVRFVARDTRMLHSSADCLRGAGYEVESLPLETDASGRRWARFRAVRGPERLLVRERLTGAGGGEWTDVSAWYWSAALGRSEGPWWAYTIAEPEARH